jgi:hypothetical protein
LQAVGLQPVDIVGLDTQFTMEEIWEAIRAILANHSPGPDGFSWKFYPSCCPVIKEDVVASMHAIWIGRD